VNSKGRSQPTAQETDDYSRTAPLHPCWQSSYPPGRRCASWGHFRPAEMRRMAFTFMQSSSPKHRRLTALTIAPSTTGFDAVLRSTKTKNIRSILVSVSRLSRRACLFQERAHPTNSFFVPWTIRTMKRPVAIAGFCLNYRHEGWYHSSPGLYPFPARQYGGRHPRTILCIANQT
jgi:hypothetical protein